MTAPDWERIRVIPGSSQTDFTAAAVDKGSGIRALAELLGGDGASGARPLAFAMGDTASDLCLFSLAERSYAPSNADNAVRQSARRQRGGGLRIVQPAYQAGFSAAASEFIGHRPGSCVECRRPGLSTDAELLITILEAQDVCGWGKFAHALRMNRLSHSSGPPKNLLKARSLPGSGRVY